MDAPKDMARELAKWSASAVADAAGGQGVVSPGLLRYSGSGTVAGRALTAECAEGSLVAVFAALEHAEAGDFLCITAPGPYAYLGDLLAADLVNRGLAGVVVDGLIRDRDSIATIKTSVFARGVTPAAKRASEPGAAMVPITVGGIRIVPGDWVVGDGDGVVVVAPEDVERVLRKAAENALLEAQIMERIQAGASVMDAVRQVLAHASSPSAG